MSTTTGIEWTDSTWNPVTGCSKVSSGCDNCYAHTLAHRLLREHYVRAAPVVVTPANRKDPFAVRLWAHRLNEPRKWKQPRRVFVNSMSDLFHVDVPDAFVRSVFEVMLANGQHVFQVLTKRPARLARFVKRNADLFESGIVPAHIWLGTSVETQAVAFRINHLRAVRATTKFLSCEPLLGPIRSDLADMDWVIAGGESGSTHRPINLAWARILRDQCVKKRIPFFFKQVGGRTPKAGGRLLDGRTWDEYPKIAGFQT